MVVGTPSAVPDDDPKLDRMSLRTTPSSPSTSTPFDPSPGYGPAVSSGITPVAVVADDEDDCDPPFDADVDVVLDPLDVAFDAQPAIATTLAPPISWSSRRRFIVLLIMRSMIVGGSERGLSRDQEACKT